MPLIRKKIGTAKMQQAWNQTAMNQLVVRAGVNTGNETCSPTTAMHDRTFSALMNV